MARRLLTLDLDLLTMKTPVSMILVGKDGQDRASLRLQLMGSGRVHIVAESGEPGRAVELVEKFRPQSAVIMLNGDAEESIGLIRRIGDLQLRTAVVCTGHETASEMIVRAYRAGASEFLCQPFSLPELNEVIGKIQSVGSATATEESRGGGIIACFSGRGGSGTTTVSVNLAAAFASRLKKPTVIVDLNLQSGTVPLFFGVEPTYTIADVAHNQDRLDAELMKNFLTKSGDDIYVLAAPSKVEEADDVHPAHVERMLPLLMGQFGFVVVDCPHTLDSNTVPVLDAASVILIVSLLDVPAVYSTKRMLALFKNMGYEEERMKLVINRYSKGDSVPLAKVEQVLGFNRVMMLSDDHRAMSNSMNLGTPLVTSQIKSSLIKEYGELAATIAGAKLDPNTKSEKKGMFQLFGTKKN